jgi:hypothetical protein
LFLFSKEAIRQKEVAGMEAQIYRLVDLLSEQRVATLDNVRRKQAKAGEDNEDDDDMGGGDISDDDSDPEDDGMIYNPKNLPLGWDGKVKSKRENFPSQIILSSSQFPIGFINYMVLICISIVKSVEIIRIVDQKHFNVILL